MKIAIAAETDTAEPRVAGTPETVKKFISLGAEVAVEMDILEPAPNVVAFTFDFR